VSEKGTTKYCLRLASSFLGKEGGSTLHNEPYSLARKETGSNERRKSNLTKIFSPLPRKSKGGGKGNSRRQSQNLDKLLQEKTLGKEWKRKKKGESIGNFLPQGPEPLTNVRATRGKEKGEANLRDAGGRDIASRVIGGGGEPQRKASCYLIRLMEAKRGEAS